MAKLRFSAVLAIAVLLSGADLLTPEAFAQSTSSSSAIESTEMQEALRLHQESLRLYEQGQYAAAVPLAARSLVIRERYLNPDDRAIASGLNNLAALHQLLGNYDAALPLYERAMAIMERRGETDTAGYALQLNNLAELQRARGNYPQAEALHQRAIALRERLLGPNAPDLATSLNNLAEIYTSQGNWDQAEALYRRALAILQVAYGNDDIRLAPALNNLALLYQKREQYDQAAPLLQQMLRLAQRLGPNHPNYAAAINNLAIFYDNTGNYERALPLYEQSLTIVQNQLGPNHPNVARALANLANAHRQKGNLETAERLLRRSLSIQEQSLGPHHPDVADSLNRLAFLAWGEGRIDEAIAFRTRSSAITERNLALIIKAGSESRKQAYMATLSSITDSTISLHIQYAPGKPAAAELALTTILQRKGRVLDALTDSQRGLLQQLGSGDRVLLEDLSKARSQLANLVFGGLQNLSVEEYKQQVSHLETKIQQIETDLSSRNASFRAESETVTLAAVQKQIPADTALVELVQYRPVQELVRNGEIWGAPRYAAYVVRSQGAPQWVDLGEVQSIDNAIRTFQRTVRDRRNLDTFQQASRDLDALLMQPIRPLLGNAKNLLISPDGQLNLIPFAALIDENGKYLVENYSVSYLTSGRDLLRLQNRTANHSNPLIVANPNFGATATAQNRSLSDLDRLQFGALPGSAAEAQAIAPFLPNATLLTDAQATETVLKQAQSPRILHIATHGFFLSDAQVNNSENFSENTSANRGANRAVNTQVGSANRSSNNSRNNSLTRGPTSTVDSPLFANPLLRSGLALSGFNARRSAAEDGVLTALEAASLNLQGTQLVVLSACETGLGDVRNGEGVYGLRRALVMAGSESQMISLWQVDDVGTKDLMVSYYDRLLKGASRSDALRQTQLELLNTPQYRHPYYWAVFIFSGDWRSL